MFFRQDTLVYRDSSVIFPNTPFQLMFRYFSLLVEPMARIDLNTNLIFDVAESLSKVKFDI